ncbi:peptidoglycan bridge formation glycyltransferase FemA/FemB family protein [Methanosarcina sp. Mfa9]|uniref:peptidoglycan bridge formation glycyltransferase FemA/FemB family protein n=1 Tax=Methanosarcina sp. Mfa9 TaxID=3439063 RepID=UPI003F83D6B9
MITKKNIKTRELVINLEISELQRGDEEGYESYIFNSDQSTFYHQIGWKNVINKSYGHKPHYLIAKQDGIIKGILPLFLVRNKLVSLPFSHCGGSCADDESIENMLLNKAIEITRERKLDYLELKQFIKKPNLLTKYNYITFFIPLDEGIDSLWKKTRKGARRSTKKAINYGVKVSIGAEYLDDFYMLYAKRNKELGSPIHSYTFFYNILKEFPNSANIEIAKIGNEIIGTKFILIFKDRIISAWAASDTKYKEYNPNSLLTWELIKYGSENNFSCIDFGRSEKDSGTFNFKNGWGGVIPQQLYYQYYLNKATKLPDVSKSNTKRKIFAICWRKIPLSITKTFGPELRKNFP